LEQLALDCAFMDIYGKPYVYLTSGLRNRGLDQKTIFDLPPQPLSATASQTFHHLELLPI